MFTLAQVSATFVAIVAGFFTAKLISISTDKQRIHNKMNEVDIRIKGLQNTVVTSNRIIDTIMDGRARKKLDFLEDLLVYKYRRKAQLFTKADVIATYKARFDNEEPNSYLTKLIDAEIEQINARVKTKFEKEEKEDTRVFAGLSTINSEIQVKQIADERNREANLLDGEHLKILAADNELSSTRDLKRQYENELKVVYSPKLVYLALIVLVVFAITGIMIPLGLAKIYPTESNPELDNFAMVLFALGLSLTLINLGAEVTHAVKDKITSKVE